jgi:N-acyl homoserine lactone hydrolase
MTSVKRLYIFLCGYEIVPKTVSTSGQGERFVLSLPISSYLVETTEGYVLLDTGMNSSYVREGEVRDKYFGADNSYPPPVVLEHHELLFQLKKMELSPGDIRHVVMSHLHYDHTGNLEHFRHARISVQAKELDHALSDKHNKSYIREDYALPDLQWHKVQGDWDIASGFKALFTPGHTPGHQSFVLELPNAGKLVLTADAGDLQENFDKDIIPGETSDPEAALTSLQRLRLEAHSGTMILGHDPVLIQSLRLAPDFYD